MLPAVALCCIGLLCLKKKPCAMAAPRRGQSCPPMPWLGEDITAHMVAQFEAGERNAVTMAIDALREVYPGAPDGQSLRWPSTPADCAEKRVLESRVILRAERLVAEARDLEAEKLWYSGGGY